MGMDIDDKLSCVIWGVITIGLLGFVGFKYASNKKQMASKLTFQEWIKKSPTSLSHLDTGNYSDSSYKGDDDNWYKLDFAARNCIEEIILSMKISNSSSCKKGTLNYFLSEYKKYNPGGALPRTLIANNTHKKIRKQTTPDSVASQTDPQSLTSNTSKDNPRVVSAYTPHPYVGKNDNGIKFTIFAEDVMCKKEFTPAVNRGSTYFYSSYRITNAYSTTECKANGFTEDLSGKTFHWNGSYRICKRDAHIDKIIATNNDNGGVAGQERFKRGIPWGGQYPAITGQNPASFECASALFFGKYTPD